MDASYYDAASTKTTSRAPTANSNGATTPEKGAAFAEAGAAPTEWMIALNRGDLDRLFDELTDPDLRFENPVALSVP